MPVILVIPQDPFDLVMQGEQMRSAAFASAVFVDAHWPEVANDGPINMPAMSTPLIGGNQDYTPGLVFRENQPRLRSAEYGTLVASNSVIATPCGALIGIKPGRTGMISDFVQATNLFSISGVTKDSTGAALGNCRVTALETGRIECDNIDATVNETTSDGSGNYSVSVPMNTAYQLVGYKAGGTDVAGVTRNDVTPTHVG